MAEHDPDLIHCGHVGHGHLERRRAALVGTDAEELGRAVLGAVSCDFGSETRMIQGLLLHGALTLYMGRSEEAAGVGPRTVGVDISKNGA